GRDPRGWRDAVEQPSGLVERGIVQESRDGQPGALDVRDRAVRCSRRLADVVSLGVDPLGYAGQPVDDLDTRVVEDVCQSVSESDSTLEREHQVRGSGAAELRP